MPAFGQKFDRTDCLSDFGLDLYRRTIMLMGGSAGLGSLDTAAARLLALPGDFQLIVLAGRNAAALDALQVLAGRHPVPVRPGLVEGRLVGTLEDPKNDRARSAR